MPTRPDSRSFFHSATASSTWMKHVRRGRGLTWFIAEVQLDWPGVQQQVAVKALDLGEPKSGVKGSGAIKIGGREDGDRHPSSAVVAGGGAVGRDGPGPGG